MKVQKTMSLDYEIVLRLMKESNASKLVNDLLSDYFSKHPFEVKH